MKGVRRGGPGGVPGMVYEVMFQNNPFFFKSQNNLCFKVMSKLVSSYHIIKTKSYLMTIILMMWQKNINLNIILKYELLLKKNS